MNVRIGWAELDVQAAPFDVRVGWAEFDVVGIPFNVCVGWAEFDCLSPASQVESIKPPAYSHPTTKKRKRRQEYNEATETYIFPVQITDEDDEETVILALLLEVARDEFF